MTIHKQGTKAAQWYVGRKVLCRPVTGSVWHRVIAAICLSPTGPTILTLEGGNDLNLQRGDEPIFIHCIPRSKVADAQ